MYQPLSTTPMSAAAASDRCALKNAPGSIWGMERGAPGVSDIVRQTFAVVGQSSGQALMKRDLRFPAGGLPEEPVDRIIIANVDAQPLRRKFPCHISACPADRDQQVRQLLQRYGRTAAHVEDLALRTRGCAGEKKGIHDVVDISEVTPL